MRISDWSSDVCSSDLLAAAFRSHGEDFRASLVSAVEAKLLHGGSYRLDWIVSLFDSLHPWCHAVARTAPFAHATLPNLPRDPLLTHTRQACARRPAAQPI